MINEQIKKQSKSRIALSETRLPPDLALAYIYTMLKHLIYLEG